MTQEMIKKERAIYTYCSMLGRNFVLLNTIDEYQKYQDQKDFWIELHIEFFKKKALAQFSQSIEKSFIR